MGLVTLTKQSRYSVKSAVSLKEKRVNYKQTDHSDTGSFCRGTEGKMNYLTLKEGLQVFQDKVSYKQHSEQDMFNLSLSLIKFHVLNELNYKLIVMYQIKKKNR